MHLVLVESPTKAKKLSQFLGKDFSVEASMGHVRDLPKSTLGVDVDADFEPKYEISEGKTAIVAKLKKLVASADKVYLATDPDREGEAIAWHLQFLLHGSAKSSTKNPPKTTKTTTKKKGPEFVRSTFHEITKSAVNAAIEHSGTINMDLVDAQQARRVVDRLVGYMLSPVLWKKVRRGLSAGRVQSVALRLIVEREKEILAFKPEEYWEVTVLAQTSDSKDLSLRLTEVKGKPYEPTSKKDVDHVVEGLKKANYVVSNVEQTERTRVSLAPFTTSTLQQAAANRLGWSAKQTMMIAQQLYEEGFITYHRTDAVILSTQAVEMARGLITTEFGKKYLPNEPRVFKKTSKNAQEAHEAIRPTDASIRTPNEGSAADPKHQKLYELIWKRFIASQIEAAIYSQTTVTVKGDDEYTLRASGSVLRFDGWMKLFPNDGDTQLPDVKEGQKLEYKDVQALQKFTEPPARYNDASLVKTLEKLGIGRPSTYASIISVILDRGYVERKEKAFIPSAIGTTVSDFLVKNFPKELDYQFTADMEDDLDAIARGEKKWKAIVRAFFTPFQKNVKEVTKDAERTQVPVEETGESCPECKEGKLVIRSGRFGRFISCSRFPECKYTAKLVEKLGDMKCPTCNEGDIVIKRTRKGIPFYGCSRYPECSFASWKKPELPGGDTLTPVLTPQTKESADSAQEGEAEQQEKT